MRSFNIITKTQNLKYFHFFLKQHIYNIFDNLVVFNLKVFRIKYLMQGPLPDSSQAGSSMPS